MKRLNLRCLAAVLVGLFIAFPATTVSATTYGSPASSRPITITVGRSAVLHSSRASSAVPVSPDILQRSCSGRPNWVHLYLSNGSSLCYGYTGVIYHEYWQATGMCAGNNYGYVDWQVGGYDYVTRFSQGNIIGWGSPGAYVYEIEILGYSGSARC
jgi:hypothetical protein